MNKKLKYTLYALIIIVIVIQLIPVDRTNPPVDPAIALQAPPEVMSILKTSCYDCHSNETTWPWYSHVAPISWLVASDVHEARHHMNFSEWENIPASRRAGHTDEMVDEVMEGGMPLPIYLIMHSNAKLTDQQKQTLKTWVESQTGGAPAETEDDD